MKLTLRLKQATQIPLETRRYKLYLCLCDVLSSLLELKIKEMLFIFE